MLQPEKSLGNILVAFEKKRTTQMASSRALARSISTGNVICVRVISMIIGTLRQKPNLFQFGAKMIRIT